MANGNTASEVPSWPPPRATTMLMLSFATAGAAAIAGFLGFCLWAGILALLSLIFNLWDFFQGRGSRPSGTSSGTGGHTSTGGDPTATGGTGGPARY